VAKVGILHPGQMGSAVGAALRSMGHEPLWASAGRSVDTAERAKLDGLEEVETLARLFAESSVVLSICPPANAREVAKAAIDSAFAGTYVDCNAVSPDTARSLADDCTDTAIDFVDGGIVGPPPRSAGSTRLFLSGDHAAEVARLFQGSPLDPIVLDGRVGAASALKMAYAAWTKGSAALLLAIRALARREGVEEALLTEWDLSVNGLRERSTGSGRFTAPKAWRFEGEMREIAATFENAGLPGDFHSAASEVYARMAGFKNAESIPEFDDILEAILAPPGTKGSSSLD